ncbi:diguanylate cyclase [Vibrio mediterranei AK1]|uniref:GGDEF domain-containing protein n=1 Tax=Vibrio mediterranei TaxID=689 RepID=UPI00015413C8|nr:sensor domain-containing diguanylate cyclase [Vibrio mediterranei]EDL54291.1 diguanylate cyclase [Vibrio mediterranei AK1]
MKLSTKITLMFTCTLLVSFSTLAWLSYQGSKALLADNIKTKMVQTTGIATRALQEKLQDIERTNDMLAMLVKDKLDKQYAKTELAAAIIPFIQNNSTYNSVSIIHQNTALREILRIQTGPNQKIHAVEPNELNNLTHIPLFVEATKIYAGEIYVSPVSTHYDRIVHHESTPYVFIVYPLNLKSDESTSLLFTIDIKALMEKATSLMDDPTTFMIANTNGDYLLHPDRDKQFSFMRGKVEQVQNDYPNALTTVNHGHSSFFELNTNTKESSLYYASFALAKFQIHQTSSAYILGHVRQDSIGSLWRENTIKSVLITTMVLLSIASVLSFSLFRYVTLPLTHIASFAQRITLGKKTTPYQYNQRDEIGDVAQALNYLQNNLNVQYEKLKNSEQKFQELARKDDLTGLPNRKDFSVRLENEIQHHRINQLHFALLFVDVNNFKLVNDHIGHHAGDELLKKIAHVLAGELRSSDLVCRHGGDEFIILLSNLRQLTIIHTICDKLHQSMERLVGCERLHHQNLSLSIGVAIYPESSSQPIELIQLADKAMYEAKKNGHAQTYWHTPFR